MLLKSLEEPASGTLFIITSTVIERLLPTIRSRGQIVRIANSDSLQTAQLPSALEELIPIFWDTNPVALLDRIYQVTKQVEKDFEEEKEKRKKEQQLLLEQLPKALRQEVENELEGAMAKYALDVGRALLEKLWFGYRSKFLQADGCTLPTPFQSTFGTKGIFTQSLLALDRGMPLSSALIMLISSR